jgi:hypothetical protein
MHEARWCVLCVVGVNVVEYVYHMLTGMYSEYEGVKLRHHSRMQKLTAP